MRKNRHHCQASPRPYKKDNILDHSFDINEKQQIFLQLPEQVLLDAKDLQNQNNILKQKIKTLQKQNNLLRQIWHKNSYSLISTQISEKIKLQLNDLQKNIHLNKFKRIAQQDSWSSLAKNDTSEELIIRQLKDQSLLKNLQDAIKMYIPQSPTNNNNLQSQLIKQYQMQVNYLLKSNSQLHKQLQSIKTQLNQIEQQNSQKGSLLKLKQKQISFLQRQISNIKYSNNFDEQKLPQFGNPKKSYRQIFKQKNLNNQNEERKQQLKKNLFLDKQFQIHNKSIAAQQVINKINYALIKKKYKM